jgi:AcrR family transcriptional regulator
MAGGRPRAFDVDEALERAVDVFWRHGFEGASLTDLTAAMRINKPSLYSVFGSKDELFRRAVARYAEHDMAYAREALAQSTAYDVARTFLRENAIALTREGRPPGCLSIQGGVSCGSDNSGIAGFLAAGRRAGEDALAARFARAVAEGDLPADTDPADLARYVSVVAEGQSVHAAAGVGRAELERSADIALRAFPGAALRRPAPDGGDAEY